MISKSLHHLCTTLAPQSNRTASATSIAVSSFRISCSTHTGLSNRLPVVRGQPASPIFPSSSLSNARWACCGPHNDDVAPAVHAGPAVSSLLSRLADTWLLDDPSSQVQGFPFTHEGSQYCIFAVRDDFLHPLYGGNKVRKLDGYLPVLLSQGVTDLVTCGGLQSAHLTAVAAACAERGVTCHLLVRGERPQTPTGYHLLSMMYGRVIYVPRAEYADRQAMYQAYSARIAAGLPPGAQVAVMEEGAGNPLALLGLIRMVCWMADDPRWAGRRLHLVVDSGTGTTVTGIALGIQLLGLPWKVSGVMLAGDMDYYTGVQTMLTRGFAAQFASAWALKRSDDDDNHEPIIEWVPRLKPRKFGKVLPGDIEACKEVARKGGPLLDPIYTLAAWEQSHHLAQQYSQTTNGNQEWQVVMIHTGGALGLFGLAQRFPHAF